MDYTYVKEIDGTATYSVADICARTDQLGETFWVLKNDLSGNRFTAYWMVGQNALNELKEVATSSDRYWYQKFSGIGTVRTHFSEKGEV